MLKVLFEKAKSKIKNRRLLVSMLLLFFVANLFAIFTTYSEKTSSTIWDGSIAHKFGGGDGSFNNPYLIKNGSELAYFFTLINSEDNTEYFNKFYEWYKVNKDKISTNDNKITPFIFSIIGLFSSFNLLYKLSTEMLPSFKVTIASSPFSNFGVFPQLVTTSSTIKVLIIIFFIMYLPS